MRLLRLHVLELSISQMLPTRVPAPVRKRTVSKTFARLPSGRSKQTSARSVFRGHCGTEGDSHSSRGLRLHSSCDTCELLRGQSPALTPGPIRFDDGVLRPRSRIMAVYPVHPIAFLHLYVPYSPSPHHALLPFCLLLIWVVNLWSH